MKNLHWTFCCKKRDVSKFDRNYQVAMDLVKKVGDEINSDKAIEPQFYKISRKEKVGMFSYVETTLRQVAFALENGMIPVVDMKGIPNTYVNDDEIDLIDMWELYFEQPIFNGNCLSSGKVILCEDKNMSTIPYRGTSIYLKESRWFWMKMYEKFFRLNERSDVYFENEYRELFKCDGSNVLGVLLRGTDMISAKGHNAQPEPMKVLDEVKKQLTKGQFDKVYLATETYANVELFRNELGENRVIVNKRVYYDQKDFTEGVTINDISFDRENDKYLRGLEYLSSVMLLSKCGGLIGGFCGGSISAFYINGGKYKYTKLYDLGVNT